MHNTLKLGNIKWTHMHADILQNYKICKNP